MAPVEWRMRGPEVASCNCSWGCPCQFNALPTRGHCRAMTAMRVDEGRFGDLDLAGVKWCGAFAWPGPIHEGGGEAFIVIDPAASEAQRNAVLTVLSGAETMPGATIFNVFAAVIDTLHPPQFVPIAFESDMERRIARVSIAGVLETEVGPIRNPVTGAEHRARVVLPDGFEYRQAEYASGRTRAARPIALEWDVGHAHLAQLDLSTHGAA